MTSECIINDWLIEISTGSLIHQQSGEQRRLGEYQLKLLIVLIQHAGQILTRDELNTLVWERRVIGNNSLPNAIHALRIALEDDGKQQRIIKTIPKKGYILETEFCVFRHLEEGEQPVQDREKGPGGVTADIFFPSHPSHIINEHRFSPENGPEKKWLNQSLNESKQLIVRANTTRRRDLWRNICIVQCLVLIMLSLTLWFSETPEIPRLIEHQAETYHNIRLLQLQRTPEDKAADYLNKLISSTLYQLDQQLRNHDVKMDIYYSSSGTALNFTTTLMSECDHQQLAMNIFHWRLEKQQLNTLIYRETERKLNEMAKCVH
ncbi:transcriptional regulator [Enterobacteriaceae bacterium LUAb1]